MKGERDGLSLGAWMVARVAVTLCLLAHVAAGVPVAEEDGEPETTIVSSTQKEMSSSVNIGNEDPYTDEDALSEDSYVDMESLYDEESEEWKREKEEYQQYLKQERDRMVEDPTYRDELLEELKEEFPEGIQQMGEMDRSLYDLAIHLQAKGLQAGKLRTKLDEAEERLVRRRRRNLRKIRHKELGMKIPSDDEIAELLGDKPSSEMESLLRRRRRAAFLQREAGKLLLLRKKVAQESNLEAKAKLVSEHQASLEELSQKLGHAPGHLEQLKEVWEKEDGLVGMQFNPKTFFKLHDMNDDEAFDALEVQALMEIEARDLHTTGSDVDELAVKEEARRMQEQMMSEYDENKDGLVDYNEFLDFAEGEGFIEDRAWHAVNPEEELLEAVLGEGAHNELSVKDLKAFRANPLKWMKERPGLQIASAV